MNSKTAYEVLGVSPSDSDIKIHEAFKALALLHHPDKASVKDRRQHAKCAFGGLTRKCAICSRTKEFAEITEAYAVLKDPKRRREYDAKLKLLGKICPACGGAGKKKVNRGFRAGATTEVACDACGGTGKER